MRFSTFFILAFLGMVAVTSGLNCYADMSPHERRVDILDSRHVSGYEIRGEREAGWGERPSPPRYVQQFAPPQQNMHDSFPQMGVNDDGSNNGEVDFDWPRFGMALVLLTGGTLVCRRIFRGASGGSRPTQLRRPPRVTLSTRPTPPPAQSLSRMCPRADCGRMNPPMAKYCRRCGAALDDA